MGKEIMETEKEMETETVRAMEMETETENLVKDKEAAVKKVVAVAVVKRI